MDNRRDLPKTSPPGPDAMEHLDSPAEASSFRLLADVDDNSVSAGRKFRKLFRHPGAWLTVGSFLFLYLCLSVLPWVPIWMGGDQTIFLHDAGRMFRGEVLYRDIFELIFPGTELVFLGMFKVFGPHTWIPNALLIVLGMALTLLIYIVSRKVLNPKHAPIPALIFLTLIFHERFDATHHWFSILAILAAVAVLVGGETRGHVFCAGALCGVAACFTQSHGLMAFLAFGFFFYLERNSQAVPKRSLAESCTALFLGFGLPILLITGPFLLQTGWSRFAYCTFIFLYKYHHDFQIAGDWRGYMLGLGRFTHLRHFWKPGTFLAVHALVPLIYILALFRYRRGTLCRDVAQRHRLLLISLVGFFLFLSVAKSPTWARMYYVSFPGILLFCWWQEQMARNGRWILNSLYALTVLLLIELPLATQVRPHEFLNLSRGRTAFSGRTQMQRYEWVFLHTHPGDYFFGGFYPDFYFLLDLRNPAPVPFLTPDDYTRPEEVADSIKGLKTHQVKLILWASSLDLPPILTTDHLGPLRVYIHRHYHVVKSFSIYQAWGLNGRGSKGAANVPLWSRKKPARRHHHYRPEAPQDCQPGADVGCKGQWPKSPRR